MRPVYSYPFALVLMIIFALAPVQAHPEYGTVAVGSHAGEVYGRSNDTRVPSRSTARSHTFYHPIRSMRAVPGDDYARAVGAANAPVLSTGWTHGRNGRTEHVSDYYRHTRSGRVIHVHSYWRHPHR